MRISIVPVAFKFAAIPAIISAACFLLNWSIFGSLFALLTLFIIYFFRDPVRKPPNIENAVLSPADGKVIDITEVDHLDYPDGKAIRVRIFLSIFNVHIQRSPIKGNISSIIYSPGKFLNALKEKSSEDNENNLVCIETGKVKVYVKQIAGAIARRIICYLHIGDPVDSGEKFGIICFGSRVEAFLPSNIEIRIKPKMKVYAGTSVLGIIKE